MKHNAAGLVAHTAAALLGVCVACATGGAEHAPAAPVPAVAELTQSGTRVQLTVQETRTRIVAAGHTWDQFLAQTSARPTYDSDFVDAWLGQPDLPDTPGCRYPMGFHTSPPC